MKKSLEPIAVGICTLLLAVVFNESLETSILRMDLCNGDPRSNKRQSNPFQPYENSLLLI